MKDSKIRAKFREYFESEGHEWHDSMSLVPPDDPTMLFTTAGMVQFKKQLLGDAGRMARAASIQKCLRTSDIDEVGKTARHLTFFEMYGNFSFGNYFKKEAIRFGWVFLTEILGIRNEKLYATVYKDDNEAFGLWKEYLPEDKIVRLGEEDNFWTMGETGPCGPCSEIIYDRGPGTGCGKPSCAVGCDCDRYLEVWNLVFTQFDRKQDGTLEDLPKKNIDTGMGLERLNQVVNGLDNVYQTATIRPLIDKIKMEAGKPEESAVRIIADHSRAAAFLIGDGVSPSNDGRGYVLRRLIRRAAREGRRIGWQEPALWKYTSVVVDMMSEYYPELLGRAEHIATVCRMEEEAFYNTLESASRILDMKISEMKKNKEKVLPGKEAFKLYDTYGLPLDITRSILEEKGLQTDEAGFEKLLRERADSSGWKDQDSGANYWEEVQDLEPTVFKGYGECVLDATVVKVLSGGRGIILDSTPFYAESGGQTGDKGEISSDNGRFMVENTVKENGVFIHEGSMEGEISEGERVKASVEILKRRDTERNHTATHILQSVLREMLGDHVQQNGSLVESQRLRFDFTHTESLTGSQIDMIEAEVNEKIMDNMAVETEVVKKEDAEKKGALAFFGEKYGDTVRTVSIKGETGDTASMELCGGTHIRNTGEIGLFKIVSESGVAAGVRRIEAVTGKEALKYVQDEEKELADIGSALKVPRDQIGEKIDKLQKDIKKLNDRILELEKRLIEGAEKSQMYEERIQGQMAVLLVREFEDTNIKAIRSWVDKNVRESSAKEERTAVFAAGKSAGKVSLILKLPESLAGELDAGRILGEAARQVGGSAGGRKDMAQGGGSQPASIGKAVEVIKKYI